MSFEQPDHENTFIEFAQLFSGDIHYGALAIGLSSLALLVFWDRFKPLKNSLVPAPLVVVLLGVVAGSLFQSLGNPWLIESSHMVQVPIAGSLTEFLGFLTFPDFSQILKPAIYVAGITIAVVASLETLLNLEAVHTQIDAWEDGHNRGPDGRNPRRSPGCWPEARSESRWPTSSEGRTSGLLDKQRTGLREKSGLFR